MLLPVNGGMSLRMAEVSETACWIDVAPDDVPAVCVEEAETDGVVATPLEEPDDCICVTAT